MGDQDERDRRGGDLPTWDGGRRAEFDTGYLPKLETVLMATFEKDDDNGENPCMCERTGHTQTGYMR